ncbi:MAG: hypothetical protein A2073_05185 [Deltaproteobacteria bacterium GWC2_42_11]|nr:MAG: hypothetical protein A2073_05185 [Deltaproteobacteria bacterium GWC2_42_11]HBO84868.1 hypothetical protein [Deltaproteobacteria bacterium]
MFRLSKASEYAIRGLQYLAMQSGDKGACHFHQVWQDVQRMFLDCLKGCTLEDIAKTIGAAKSVQN